MGGLAIYRASADAGSVTRAQDETPNQPRKPTNPRPDTADPATGERYADVIVFWVESELEKEAILADASLPFFTTAHFDGHPSVLLRGSRVGELSREELGGFVEAVWLSRAGPRAIAKWLKERGQG